jgi:hypothetical protein
MMPYVVVTGSPDTKTPKQTRRPIRPDAEDAWARQLYFAADMTSVVLSLPEGSEPPSLWTARAGAEPVAAWLLTPETYAVVRWKVERLSERWARGECPDETLAQAADRFEALIAWANEHFDPADTRKAYAAILVAGGPGPLPRPAPLPVSPFEPPVRSQTT